MAVDMRAYDNIVDEALDISKKHREDERTEGELRNLLGRFHIEMEEDALRALMRYVNLSHYRHRDSMRNLGL